MSAGISAGLLLRAEARRQRHSAQHRAVVALAGVLTVLTALLVGGSTAPVALRFDRVLTAAGSPVGVLSPVLGVLAVTTLWSRGADLFTHEPRRWRMPATAVLVALGVVAGLTVLSITAAAAVLGWRHYPGSAGWAPQGRIALEVLGDHLLLGMAGAAGGLLLRSASRAVVAAVLLPTLVTALVHTGAAGVLGWVDLAGVLVPLSHGGVLGTGWSVHLAVVAAVWIVGPAVVGTMRLSRSDLR